MINSVVHAGTRMLESGELLKQVHRHLQAILGPSMDSHHHAPSESAPPAKGSQQHRDWQGLKF
jgi:hypothetical protein